MSVQIHINGDSAHEILAELKELSAGLYVGAKPAFAPEVGNGVQTTIGNAQTTSSNTAKAVVGEAGPIGTGGVSGDVSQPVEKPTRKPRGTKASVTDTVDLNEKQSIQTGGEREPVPEATAGQQAEAPAAKLLTLDDVRTAAKPYIDKFGMPAASSDLTPCLIAATGCKAISELDGKDQATLKAAVDAFTAAGQAPLRYGQTKA